MISPSHNSASKAADPPLTVPDHFDLVPRTPHSAAKSTTKKIPAKPLLYCTEPAHETAATVLPPSPIVLKGLDTMANGGNQKASQDLEMIEDGIECRNQQLHQQEQKRESVFERLYRMGMKRGDPMYVRRGYNVTRPLPKKFVPGTLPARSTKPLTVPQSVQLQTEKRAMQREVVAAKDQFKVELIEDKGVQKRVNASTKRKPELTVPISPQFASEQRMRAKKQLK